MEKDHNSERIRITHNIASILTWFGYTVYLLEEQTILEYLGSNQCECVVHLSPRRHARRRRAVLSTKDRASQ